MRRAIEEGLVDVAHCDRDRAPRVALRARGLDGPARRARPRLPDDRGDLRARRRRRRGADPRPRRRSAGVHQLRHRRRRSRLRAGHRHARGRAGRRRTRCWRSCAALRGIDFVGFDVVEVIPAYDPGRPDGHPRGEPRLRDAVAGRAPPRRPVTERESWRVADAAGFRWPDGVRAAACFTFDVDAESPILFEHPEAADWLDVMSHQAYGPRTGVAAAPAAARPAGHPGDVLRPRLHRRALARRRSRAIRDAGHEIGHHGYLHEGAPARAPTSQERRLVRGLEALDAVLGVRPTGYRGPMWELTYDTPAAPREARLRVRLRADGRGPSVPARDVGGARRAGHRRAAGPLVRSTTGSRTTTCPGSPARA